MNPSAERGSSPEPSRAGAPPRRRLPRWPRTAAPNEPGETPPLGVDLLGRGLAARGPRGATFTRVELDVPAGGLAVVHGPGGSGRSTLLLALGGRYRLTAGELRVGDALAGDGLAPLRALSTVARILPGVEPDEGLRIRELEREAELASAGRTSAARIAAAYELLEIEPDRAALIGDLHPLEALLVTVALAVAEHRPLVLVDDVEEGLPAADLRRAWRALDAVADAGPTVVVSALEPPDDVEHVAIALPHPSEHRRAVERERRRASDDDRPAPSTAPDGSPADGPRDAEQAGPGPVADPTDAASDDLAPRADGPSGPDPDGPEPGPGPDREPRG